MAGHSRPLDVECEKRPPDGNQSQQPRLVHLREDLDDNATLYGEKLENSEIMTKGVRPPKAAAKLLELRNRYSARERENWSHVAA